MFLQIVIICVSIVRGVVVGWAVKCVMKGTWEGGYLS